MYSEIDFCLTVIPKRLNKFKTIFSKFLYFNKLNLMSEKDICKSKLPNNPPRNSLIADEGQSGLNKD